MFLVPLRCVPGLRRSVRRLQPCIRFRVTVTASERLCKLRQLIDDGSFVRVMEVHNGLGGLIAQSASATRHDGSKVTFDAVWSSSLTSSASKGKPDIEVVDTSGRLSIVEDVLEVCSMPVIYDGDTGGLPEVFGFTVKTLERLGVSACIIEDKTGLKQNSLFGTERAQVLEEIPDFCRKLRAGRAAKMSEDFMIIARLEALIAGLGQEEALKRAKAYIEAGADGIMIHSKEKDPQEVVSFLKEYAKFQEKVPVVAVPTTYNSITEQELQRLGVSVCIYANQMLRAAYPSMMNVAEQILRYGRSQEVDRSLMSVKEIITLIDKNKPRSEKKRPLTELHRDFIAPEDFFRVLKDCGVYFFTGVPDSLLYDVSAYISDHYADNHVITANEGSAIAVAAGYHLATGGVPLVYMQNSGLGNAINPLLSLADPKVYGIPMILLIGWRGQPGKKDEPQHMVQGKRMRSMLDAMQIPYEVMPDFVDGDGGAREIVTEAVKTARKRSQPFCLLVKRQTFTPYTPEANAVDEALLMREEVLRTCLAQMSSRDVVVGTTGFTSREIYTIRDEMGQSHASDFLTVGSMGHASAIALGVAKHSDRNVVCFDGDGSVAMHMGNLATIAATAPKNLKHVVINNGVHDSVGGQPTQLKAVASIAAGLGYRWSRHVESKEDLAAAFGELLASEGPGILEVRSRPGTRDDLGRPKTSPEASKRALMGFISDQDF